MKKEIILMALATTICISGTRIHSRRHVGPKIQSSHSDCETVWNREKNEILKYGLRAEYDLIEGFSGEIIQKKCGTRSNTYDIDFCLNVCQLNIGDHCNPELKAGVDICARGLHCSDETRKCIDPTEDKSIQTEQLREVLESFDFSSSSSSEQLDELLSLLLN
jgi:hypothetical protein